MQRFLLILSALGLLVPIIAIVVWINEGRVPPSFGIIGIFFMFGLAFVLVRLRDSFTESA